MPEIASPSQARKLRKKGLLRKNGQVCSEPTTVAPGDELTVYSRPILRRLYKHSVDVVYEDDHMAIVIKNPGLRTSGNRLNTLVNCLPYNLKPCPFPDGLHWPHSVHRLDDRTGGLVVCAKSGRANVGLGRVFQRREVSKRYRAIVTGRLEGSGRVDEPIDERAAASRWRVVQHNPCANLGWVSTVDLWPETGRTHQLRRHMASLGHPILGDDLYSPTELLNLSGKGLYLWAVELRLRHPVEDRELHICLDEPGKFGTRRRWMGRRWIGIRELGPPPTYHAPDEALGPVVPSVGQTTAD